MQQVWMKRVRVFCDECECWDTEGHPSGDGLCRRESAKFHGDFRKGYWPLTDSTDWCFEGIQMEKEVLND